VSPARGVRQLTDGPWRKPWEWTEVKTTKYFEAIRNRPDRKMIPDEWIERVIASPVAQVGLRAANE